MAVRYYDQCDIQGMIFDDYCIADSYDALYKKYPDVPNRYRYQMFKVKNRKSVIIDPAFLKRNTRYIPTPIDHYHPVESNWPCHTKEDEEDARFLHKFPWLFYVIYAKQWYFGVTKTYVYRVGGEEDCDPIDPYDLHPLGKIVPDNLTYHYETKPIVLRLA